MDIKDPASGGLRAQVVLFFTLMLFWIMLMGSVATDSLIVGAIASLAITLFFKEGFSFFTEFRGTPSAIIAGFKYYAYFLKELVKSNLTLTAITLSPSLPVEPGIVKVRTKLKSRMGRLMLANSITLTPGTLSVELDGEFIYVHWVKVDTTDTEEATKAIVEKFESYLEVMYG